ncbi:MAG: portal protein, partial [Dongiaceae bacterium]
MTESELKAILAAEIGDSLGHLAGELSEQRRKALRYYLGEPFGNEVDGRSKV